MTDKVAYRMMQVNPFCQAINYDALKSERARLESFLQPPEWSITFIRPEDCAYAGFFYLRDGDKVQCAFCKGVIGNWEQGDAPMTEHRRHFTCCPFICGLPVGNVPLKEESAGATSLYNQEETVVAEKQQPLIGNETEAVTSLAIRTCGNGPVHRGLVTIYSRINTFTNWPKDKKQTPIILAEAGFFFSGRRDDVRCFYCNGGLNEWEASDDPWVEHARWFSNCTYLILIKGEEFVKKIHKINPPVRRVIEGKSYEGNEYTPRVFSYEEIQNLMGSPIIQTVLEMGIDSERIFKALFLKIQRTGEPFLTTNDVLEAVSGPNAEIDESSQSDSESDAESDAESYSESDSDTIEVDEEEMMNPHQRNYLSYALPNNTSITIAYINEVQSINNIAPLFASTTIHPPLLANSSGNNTVESESVFPNTSTYQESKDAQEAVVKPEKTSTTKSQDVSDLTVCKICMDSQIGIVFLPCGHFISCTRCATTLSNCALCRTQIKAMVRAYFS